MKNQFATTTPPEVENDRGIILSILIIAIIGIFLSLGWFIQNWKMMPAPSKVIVPLRATENSSSIHQLSTADYRQRQPEMVAQNTALTHEQFIEQKLLNHPDVTPGRGFRKPGVQSTGNTIVDALDNARLNNK